LQGDYFALAHGNSPFYNMPRLANKAAIRHPIRHMGRVMKFDVVMTEEEALYEAGHRLAQIRLARNLSQAELAARAGVSKRSLERLEKGSGSLRLDLFFSVCGALGLIAGFEALLPEQHMSPQDILAGQKPPQRVRRRGMAKRKPWGTES
jgi:DNA-binding XRE family transcriptional regulator